MQGDGVRGRAQRLSPNTSPLGTRVYLSDREHQPRLIHTKHFKKRALYDHPWWYTKTRINEKREQICVLHVREKLANHISTVSSYPYSL